MLNDETKRKLRELNIGEIITYQTILDSSINTILI